MGFSITSTPAVFAGRDVPARQPKQTLPKFEAPDAGEMAAWPMTTFCAPVTLVPEPMHTLRLSPALGLPIVTVEPIKTLEPGCAGVVMVEPISTEPDRFDQGPIALPITTEPIVKTL